MKYNLVQRYWVDSPKLFEERMKEIVGLHHNEIEVFELCKPFLNSHCCPD